jgi:hypothetical protein
MLGLGDQIKDEIIGKRPLSDQVVDGKILLQLIVKEQGGGACTGFVRLRIQFMDGQFLTRY